jgi:hypothetical protein
MHHAFHQGGVTREELLVVKSHDLLDLLATLHNFAPEELADLNTSQ